MARTPVKTNNRAILDILAEVEGENGLSNRGILFQTIATKYNERDFVIDGSLKPISHSIVRMRLEDEEVALKTPKGKRTKKEILSSVEDTSSGVQVIEETPDGGTPKPKAKKSRKKTVENNKDGIDNIVKVPTRDPIGLSSFDHESITTWMDRMRDIYKRNNEYYTKIAACHDVRKKILPGDPDKSRDVCTIIMEHIQDEYA